MLNKKGFEALEENLLDIVAEEQAKLGFMREKIRLYYPLNSLNHMLGTCLSSEEMQERLSEFSGSVKERLGEIAISHKEERFCFRLPEKTAEYVHERKEENRFIFGLVELLSHHGCTMEEIITLFQAEGPCVIEAIDNGEFDTLIRFTEGKDRYYYCFKDEGCHIIYHRYLPEDYEEFGF